MDCKEAAEKLKKDGWRVDWDRPFEVGYFVAMPPNSNSWVRFSSSMEADYPFTVDGVLQARSDYREES